MEHRGKSHSWVTEEIPKEEIMSMELTTKQPGGTMRLPMDVYCVLLALCTAAEDTKRATRVRKQGSVSPLGI